MGDKLRKNMIGALTWSSVNIFGVQFLQLFIGIILARVLMPEDFGIIGILFVFTSISGVLIDGGFAQGLIRKKDTTNKDFSTVFFLNLLVSVILYGLLYLSAPLIADFFAQPALVTYSRVLFIIILIFPFYLIQQTQLFKKLQYKTIAIVNIISVGVSGTIAIVLAFRDFGVWALVIQQICFHSMRWITYTLFVRWKPVFVFTKSTIKDLWKFSLPLLGQTSLNAVFNQIYFIIIGRFYPIQQVGYFTQANKYSETINYAAQSILSVGTFPVLSTIQDDKERLLSVYRKLITSVSIITFPFVTFLIVAAEPIVVTLITEKWLPSVILLQLLLFANLFTPMFTINISILNAQGKSALSLRLEIIKKSLIVVSILVCFSFGLKAMLAGFVVANYIAYAVSMASIKKSLMHFYKHQVRDLWSGLIASSVAGLAIITLHLLKIHLLLKISLMGVVFISIYGLMMFVFFPAEWKIIKNTVLKITNLNKQ
jgi:teichuronic acid exporter